MKKLAILLFSILISFNSYGELIEVFKDSRATDYVDTNTIELKEGKIYFWTVSNFAKPIWSSKMLSSKSQVVVDCPNGNLKILNLSMHKQPIGEGLGEKIFMKPKWQNPKELNNPFAEAYLDFVCNFIDSKTNYYPTGEVSSVVKFVDGRPLKATVYHKTGGVKQVEEFVNGKLSKITFYHKTGEVDVVQEYVNGKHSKVTFYHKTGEVKKVDEYVDGKPLNSVIHYKTGNIKSIQEYINNKPSKVTAYYETGELDQVSEYINGKLSKTTFYNMNGLVDQITEYNNGQKSKTTFYYESGEVESIKKH